MYLTIKHKLQTTRQNFVVKIHVTIESQEVNAKYLSPTLWH